MINCLKKNNLWAGAKHITISLLLSSVLVSSPQCKLVMHNIDNYISNDAYTEKSLGAQQSSSGFLQENTHFLKNTFSLFMSPYEFQLQLWPL